LFKRGWRLWAVRLVACAFIVQTIGLFAASAPPAASSVSHAEHMGSAKAPMSSMSSKAMENCPIHRAHGKPGESKKQDDACPMCQTLGCALPGAVVVGLTALPGERLIGLLAVAQPPAAPRAPPQRDSRPRGPPAFV
jgi:hypothetical protein